MVLRKIGAFQADDGEDKVAEVQIVMYDFACFIYLFAEQGRKLDFPCGKIDAACEDGDDRHDDVVRERSDEILEHAADENADSHIKEIALQSKFLKLLACVERSMRHAIEVCCNRTDSDTILDYFGRSMNPNSGKPTNSEFIFKVADELRLDHGNESVLQIKSSAV